LKVNYKNAQKLDPICPWMTGKKCFR